MRHLILCVLVAGGLLAATAQAARDPDVDKAIKRVYPDAQTQVTNSRDINGVKVYDVSVKTKDGDSYAQVTENGDFVSYGMPRSQNDPVIGIIQNETSGLFKSAPQNVDMYRVTNYIVDLQGAKNKVYRARFDALGRLMDLNSHADVQREMQQETAEKAAGSGADQAKKYAQQYFPDAKPEDVYKSDIGDNYYNVKTDKGIITVGSNGRFYAMRETIDKNQLPKSVMDAVNNMFNANSIKDVYRGESEYYQFDEQTPTGEQVVVRMRPNGDILKVITPHEADQDQTMTAAHHEKAEKKNKKKNAE